MRHFAADGSLLFVHVVWFFSSPGSSQPWTISGRTSTTPRTTSTTRTVSTSPFSSPEPVISQLDHAPAPIVFTGDILISSRSEKYETDGYQAWYFFTSRNRRYPNGRRPSRSTKQGYWRATGSDKCIMDPRGTAIIGLRKSLVFYVGKQGKDNGNKTPLMMHEYTIPETQVPLDKEKPTMKLDDWVLCKIYYNRSDDRSSTKKNLTPGHRNESNCLSVRHQPLKKCPPPIYGTPPQFNVCTDNQLIVPQLPTTGTLNQQLHEPNSFVYIDPPLENTNNFTDPMQFPELYFNPLENTNNFADPMQFPELYFNPLENTNNFDVASSFSNQDSGYSNNKILSDFNDPSCPIYLPPRDDYGS